MQVATVDETWAIRNPDHPIEGLFLRRWSPRAFDEHAALPEQDLWRMLEAARWAPSAFNIQPWRFLYALRGDGHWINFLELLDPFNQDWARRCSALVFVVSERVVAMHGTKRPSRSHSFDAGAAWAQFALQATAMGYQTHAMGGLLYEKARARLSLPQHFRLEIGIAVGKTTKQTILPEQLREREYPSDRNPLAQFAFSGGFPKES